MRRENPIASAQDTVQSVMQTMTATKARHVPILEWGRVIGIVSIGDIVKSCLHEKTQENTILQDLGSGSPDGQVIPGYRFAGRSDVRRLKGRCPHDTADVCHVGRRPVS